MLEYSRKFVANVECAIRVDLPEGNIRRLQFAFEEELKSIFKEPSRAFDPQQVPANFGPIMSASPLPRWFISENRKALIATDSSMSLNFNFVGYTPNDGVFSVVRKNVASLDLAVDKLIGRGNVLFAGIVVGMNFVFGGAEALISQDIASALLRIPEGLDVNNASAGVGFRGDGSYARFNFSYNFAPYRTVSITAPVSRMPMPSSVDLEALEPTERGLQIRVDVNDRGSDDLGDAGAVRGRLTEIIEASRMACGVQLNAFFRDINLTVSGL